MKCPKCGTEYEGQFCPNGCNSYKQCPVCGTIYTGNFCPKGCKPGRKKSKGWIAVPIALGVLVVFFAVILLVPTPETETEPQGSTAAVVAKTEEDRIVEKVDNNISATYKETTYRVEAKKVSDAQYAVHIALDISSYDEDYDCGCLIWGIINGVNQSSEFKQLISQYNFELNQEEKLAYTAEYKNDEKQNSIALKTAEGTILEAKTKEQYSAELDAARKKAEEIKASQEKASQLEYINSFKSIPYNDLIRNPDAYVGQKIKVEIEINQIISEGFLTEGGYRGYEDYDLREDETYLKKEWVVLYELDEGETKILEDDVVAFYGEYQGTKEVERAVLNIKESLPYLKGEFYEIVKEAK